MRKATNQHAAQTEFFVRASLYLKIGVIFGLFVAHVIFAIQNSTQKLLTDRPEKDGSKLMQIVDLLDLI